jgi:hypothetical protein
MSASSYLVKQRNSTALCFRIRIPVDLQGIVGKSELRYSVRTSDPELARVRALDIGRNVKLLLKLLRRKLGSESSGQEGSPYNKPEIINKMFDNLLQKYLEKWLSEEEERRVLRPRPMTQEELDHELDTFSDLENEAIEDLTLSDYRRISSYVDEILIENRINEIEKHSEPYKKLCRELLKTNIRYYEIERKRALGNYQSEAELHPVASPEQPCSNNDAKSPALSEVIKQYSDEQCLGKRWTEKTTGETLASLDLLLEILGDVPVNTITPLNLRDFKSKLMALPPRATG